MAWHVRLFLMCKQSSYILRYLTVTPEEGFQDNDNSFIFSLIQLVEPPISEEQRQKLIDYVDKTQGPNGDNLTVDNKQNNEFREREIEIEDHCVMESLAGYSNLIGEKMLLLCLND